MESAINDFAAIFADNVIMFAVDVKLIYSRSDLYFMEHRIHISQTWSVNDQLSLNAFKSNHIAVGHRYGNWTKLERQDKNVDGSFLK